MPDTQAHLRTDTSFNEMDDEYHHFAPTPLKELGIGLVSQFGLDYMHLVYLGVMRRFLLYWKGPLGPLNVRLSSRDVESVSKALMSFNMYIPCELRPQTTLINRNFTLESNRIPSVFAIHRSSYLAGNFAR